MKKKKENNLLEYLSGIIIVLVIIGLWCLTYYKLKDLEPNVRGTLGDMFGTVNALFSGLALAGIIFTILLQRKELGYQREELRETRKEFEIQNKTLTTQRFENTFFNLLSLHHQIIEGIDFDIQIEKENGQVWRAVGSKRDFEIVTVKGRDVFKDKFEILNNSFSEIELKDFNNVYLSFYNTVQTDFGHYFRNLYRIIKFVDTTEFISKSELEIDSNKITEADIKKYNDCNFLIRYSYTSMIRAQLSDYELLWLFYNCLSENGVEFFKPLVEKYTLIKNMPKDKLSNIIWADEYDDSAFKKTNPVHNNV